MNIQMTLAARYLRGRKMRTILTTLAIVFGVLMIFGMNTILPAFSTAFQANSLAASGQVDATVTLKSAGAFDAAVAERVAAVDGVRVVSGLLNRSMNVTADYFDGDPSIPDAISALTLVGLDVDQATALHSYRVIEGRFLEPAAANSGGAAEAVLSQSLSEAIGIGLGETLSLPAAGGETELTVVGILPSRVLPGNEEVLVTLAQAEKMLAMPGRINTIEVNYNSLDETRRAAIERAILDELGDTYQIGALEANSELLTNMRLAQSIFNVLGILALLMGGFIIFNTFRTVVAERRRDIGMLRALGANRRTIFGTITTEGLIQGLIGTALGLVLGYLFGLLIIYLLSPVLQQYMNVRIGSPVVTAGLVIASLVVGVGVTLMAGLLPAMNASKVTPLEALQPVVGVISLNRLIGIGFWAGLAMIILAVVALLTRNVSLIGLGAILFIVGLILIAPTLVNPIARFFSGLLAVIFARSGTAQLAEGNLSRQPARAAITASTTLIGMAILIMAASIISSVHLGFGQVMRKSLGSDYLFVPPSVAVWGTNVGAGAELADELRRIDGVAVVSSLRFAPAQVDEVAVSLMGIDPTTYPLVSGLTFSEGDASAYNTLQNGRAAIINPVLATTLGASQGDEIEMITPAGRQTYQVAGVGGDYLNAKIATAYISHANIAADFERNEDVLLQVNLAAGADKMAVESDLKAALVQYPQFRLISGQAYIEENLRLFDAAFSGMYALVIFLAIPSLIAMINTLAIGVIERTREIGMIRAVGATRRQVRTVVLAEALILSALGTIFGVLAGLYLGYMGVEAIRFAGFPMEYVFPTMGVAIAIGAGIVFGVLAAIIPARQASRLEIVQALRYE